MGLARANAIALVGVEGHVVEIEADIENGLVTLLLVGLPDTALREARDRIRSAIVNSGETWPSRRITVGLSPASLPAAAAAAAAGFDAVVVAVENAAEAALVPELRVIAAPTLSAFTAFMRNGGRAGDVGVQVHEPGRDIMSYSGATAAPSGPAGLQNVRSCRGRPAQRLT